MASLHGLSPEILDIILGCLSRQDLRQLRLVDKFLSRAATPLCFKRVEFALEDGQFDHVIQIAFHEELSHFVKELELVRSLGLCYVSFSTFKFMAAGVHSGASRNQNENDDTMDDKVLEEYKEYEAECLRLHKQGYSAAEQMSFRRTGCKRWTKRVHPDKSTPTRLDKFEEAILRLPKLKSFTHVPGFWRDNLTSHWPSLTLFNAMETVSERLSSFDKRIEALQLSYVLRALGWANQFNHNLSSIDIYVGSSPFWSPRKLQNLWEYTFKNHKSKHIQPSYSSFDSETYDSDGDDSDDRGVPSTATLDQALYMEQIFLIENSFRFLTKLVCAIEAVRFTNELHGHLLRMFLSCVHLEWLDLTFGRLDGYFLAPTMLYGSCTDELFTSLTQATPWLNLQKLELSTITKASSLLALLNSLRSTLRFLHLCYYRLSDGPTWETTLREIASGLHLKSLTLTALYDFHQVHLSTFQEDQQRLLFQPEHEFWCQISSGDDTGGICYKHYYESIVNACLHYTNEHWQLPPLDPLIFLQRHVQECDECRVLVFQARQRVQERRK